jgi:DNA-binding SARP family transcriptional activator
MEFRILGPLEAWDDRRQIELGGSKRRAVLAFLVLHANEVVGRDRLIDELWGEQAPRNASAALHSHVSRLRKQLGPDVLATRAWGYIVRTEPGEIDLERFQRLVDDAEPLPARERAEKLREALALWRGGPLEDLAFEPALARDVARLEELRLAVLENRIDADLEAGYRNDITGELEALIAEHPLRERLRGQLILALYRGGRQAEALEVYRETRRVLADELGLEPSPELRELERAILRQDPSLVPTEPSAERVLASRGRPGRRRRLFGAAGVVLLAVGGALAYAAVRQQGSTHAAASATPAQQTVTVAAATTPAAPVRRGAPRRRPTPEVTARHAPRTRRVQHRFHRPSRAAKATRRVAPSPVQSARASAGPPPTGTRTTSRHRLRIADSFNSSVFDGTIWYVIREGSGFDVGQENGRLVWSFASGATPGGTYDDVGGHYGTRCRFPGDFDARVDYTLLEWPPGTASSPCCGRFSARRTSARRSRGRAHLDSASSTARGCRRRATASTSPTRPGRSGSRGPTA